MQQLRTPAVHSSAFHRKGLPGWTDTLLERLAPCPWPAAGGTPSALYCKAHPTARPAPLYTSEERRRRDRSIWTRVQAVLAPLQFAIFAASLVLVLRYLATGEGLALATGSVLAKTVALYAIMITGSIWEKDVFGKWLFARPFFWEDMVSMLVLALHTAYLAAVVLQLGSPAGQMWLALAAYASYVVNAGQFLWKLRQARLEGAGSALAGAPG